MKQKKYLIFLFILSLIVSCIEVDISVPSFPDMAKYFMVYDGKIQQTITYNFLGFFLASFIYGPLSDFYGRRKVMIYGSTILLIGSLGCYLSESLSILLFFRFIQGVGAATPAVITFIMISDIFSKQRAVTLIGTMNCFLTTFTALAPIIGGYINQYFGWRGNYFVVAAISIISWFFMCTMLPETKLDNKKSSMVQIKKDFITLLSNYSFNFFSLIPSLMYTAYMCYLASASFLYLKFFDISMLSYTLQQSMVVSSFAITSIFAGKIRNKLGDHYSILFGALLCFLGIILLNLTSFILPIDYLITISMCIFCVGFAINYPIIFYKSLEIFPEKKGTASSIIMSTRALVVSIFTGVISILYDGNIIIPTLVITVVVMTSLLMIYVSGLLSKLQERWAQN